MTKKKQNIHKEAQTDKVDTIDLGDVEPEETLILKNNIEVLEKEIDELNNKLTQSKAELINYRKRKDEEVARMLKYSSTDLLERIVSALDNFDRAIKSAPKTEEYKNFLKGFELTYDAFLDALAEEGVKKVPCLHKLFDENVAEAIALDNDKNKENDVVTEVYQDAYIYKDRLLRAAKVKVNKIEGEK